MGILLFLRDAALITLYFTKKFIDHSAEPLIRPQVEGKYMSKVDMDASITINNYLLEQKDESLDPHGNTNLHQAVRTHDLSELEQLIS